MLTDLYDKMADATTAKKADPDDDEKAGKYKIAKEMYKRAKTFYYNAIKPKEKIEVGVVEEKKPEPEPEMKPVDTASKILLKGRNWFDAVSSFYSKNLTAGTIIDFNSFEPVSMKEKVVEEPLIQPMMIAGGVSVWKSLPSGPSEDRTLFETEATLNEIGSALKLDASAEYLTKMTAF